MNNKGEHNMKKIKWFASGGHIALAGPYDSQMAAYKAFILDKDVQEKQRKEHGACCPYPYNIIVWPEEVKEN
jgi:hypothetical protein